MLIDFTLWNYRSFKDENTLSFIATKDNDKVDDQVVVLRENLRVLKHAVIFGANASGKSNLLKALMFVRSFIINSSKEGQRGDSIDAQAFRFSTETEDQPSGFEFKFDIDGTIYRYGFEVDNKIVVSEWLYARNSTKEAQLFFRDHQKFELGTRFSEGKKFIEIVRDNALFLSVCAQFNGEISTAVLKWVVNLRLLISSEEHWPTSIDILENRNDAFSKQKGLLLKLVTECDLGIEGVILNENKEESLFKILSYMQPETVDEILIQLQENKDKVGYKVDVTSHTVMSTHTKYDKEHQIIEKVLSDFSIESTGTQKVFDLAGPIIDTLIYGGVLMIDELQNSLHTKLVLGLIEYIIKNNIHTNAQFVFIVHDTNILSSNLFRRDQMWFVEKDKYGASELTCLTDFNEHVRKDASLAKDYLRGRYGAIPYLKLGGIRGNS